MMTERTSAGGDRSIRKVSLRLAARWALCLLALSGPVVPAAGKDKKKAPEPYALIAGTVFRDIGFAQPGALVLVTPVAEPGSKAKVKKTQAVSDARGEFAIRVPAAPVRYTVSVKASGFRSQEKLVRIGGDERVDVFFHLEAEKP